MKNILIIGSGAREHAIARAFKRSSQNPILFYFGTSHNPGLQTLCKEYAVGPLNDLESILQKAHEWKIDLAIIGPEAPLEKGLSDLLWANHIPTVGPKKILAQLETSKAFTRDLLKKYHISGSPLYRTFHDMTNVSSFLNQLGENNYVIKANGLMGGKGVKVAGEHLHSFSDAYAFCESLYAQGQSFVIEEKFIGQEFSLLCFCDGENVVPMPAVQDHKRAFVNDQGPNTGGMGSYSDANSSLPFLTSSDLADALHINQAVICALTEECGEKYQGILYGSFMATREGVKLIEFNARFGDPEAMNVLAILESDLLSICEAIIAGTLTASQVHFSPLATVCKYAVPHGYPDYPEKNFEIDVSDLHHPDQLYFASVDAKDGKLIATGSRAVAVLGIAKTIAEAEKIAEAEIQRVRGNLFHREDIGTEKLIRQRIQHMEALRMIEREV